MNSEISRPTSYWVIAIAGLLWNLMGCYSFFREYNYWKNPPAREVLPEAMRGLYDTTPAWLYIIFAIAVFGGVLGCIGLIMKKSWAVPVFLVSLIAILIQMVYSLFGTGMYDLLGPTSLIMPSVVIIIAVLLWFYAKSARTKGWIS